ncbi:spinster family MFS transporter [Paraburkholderia aromaticivorans]|uniref:spinster family MFS transporter n=1 Tax=Paraburkholderia aromaticivorans TaxID=2026199 RepID=UPI001F0FC59F|nr:MFS transporter [Paraburkholderia aromaticivorans]
MNGFTMEETMSDESGTLRVRGITPTASYRVWLLSLLVLTYAWSFVDRIILSVVGQAIKTEMNLTDLQLGLLGGLAFSIFYSVLSLPISRLAERYSRVMLISVAIAGWSIMTALCGTAGSYWQLLMYRIGVGIGEAGGTPAAHSLIADQFPPERRATALSIYALGPPLGVFIGALGGGWVAQHYGWRAAFLVMGLPGLIVAMLTYMTLREPDRGASELGKAAAPEGVPSFAAVVRTLLADKAAVQMVLGYVVGSFALYGINLFIPVYLTRAFGMNSAEAGLVFAVAIGVAGMIGNGFGGLLTDRLASRNVQWYGLVPALGTIIGFPIMAIAFLQREWPVAITLIFVSTVLLSFFYGATNAVIQGTVTPRMRARAAAFVLLLVSFVGQGGGPAVVGFLSDKFSASLFTEGNYRLMCGTPHVTGGHGVSAFHGALVEACADASATGIRYAMLSITVVLAWSALHYFLASRTMRRR